MRRQCLRFSISTILFVILLTGGFLAGYRHGFHQGDFDGTSARIGYEFLEDTHFTTTHDIGELVLGNNVAACEFDPKFIVAIIKDVVDQTEFTIENESLNLVVACDGRRHKEIAAIVDQLAHIDKSAVAKLESRLGLNSSAAKPSRFEKETALPSSRLPIAHGGG